MNSGCVHQSKLPLYPRSNIKKRRYQSPEDKRSEYLSNGSHYRVNSELIENYKEIKSF